MVIDEARLASERINGELASQATLFQMAVSSVLSQKAGENFNKMIKRMTSV